MKILFRLLTLLKLSRLLISFDNKIHSFDNNIDSFDDNQLSYIHGINWFGFETDNQCLLGLYAQPIENIIQLIYSNGINAIRLPISLETLINDPIPKEWLLTANPIYQRQSVSYIIHNFFKQTNEWNISILIDIHRLKSGISTPLWYIPNDPFYTEETLFLGYEKILQNYGNYSNFLGIDLWNEPHYRATWGTNDIKVDFRLFVQRVIDYMEIHYHNQPFYIVVNGIDWGKNLSQIQTYPLTFSLNSIFKNYIIYSPHLYGPSLNYIPSYEKKKLFEYWNHLFGFLPSDKIWIGEWGGRWSDSNDKLWIDTLIEYFHLKKIKHHFYWALNPDSKDVDGLLELDWKSINQQVFQSFLDI